MPDDEYMLVMPSLAIINDKLDEAAGLMKSNSEPCKLSYQGSTDYNIWFSIEPLVLILSDAKDIWFNTQIARTQLSMNFGHLMAIIIVPMISVLSVKTFNYN